MLYLYSPKIIVLFKSSAYSLNKSQNGMSTKMCQFVVVVVDNSSVHHFIVYQFMLVGKSRNSSMKKDTAVKRPMQTSGGFRSSSK